MEFHRVRKFTITDQHIRLARNMRVTWWDMEFGAPAIDPKRPYGQKDVIGSIIEILGLGIEEDAEYGDYPEDVENRLTALHDEMQLVLQIFLCTGQMIAGTYVKTEEYDSLTWKLQSDV